MGRLQDTLKYKNVRRCQHRTASSRNSFPHCERSFTGAKSVVKEEDKHAI
jgi:hypothetical protein